MLWEGYIQANTKELAMQSLRCDPSGTRGRFWLHGSSQQVLGGFGWTCGVIASAATLVSESNLRLLLYSLDNLSYHFLWWARQLHGHHFSWAHLSSPLQSVLFLSGTSKNKHHEQQKCSLALFLANMKKTPPRHFVEALKFQEVCASICEFFTSVSCYPVKWLAQVGRMEAVGTASPFDFQFFLRS